MHATADDSIDEAAADVTILLRDGTRLHRFVGHAIGSLERPMSDADLGRKFATLVGPVLGDARAHELFDLASRVARAPDLRELLAQACPA